MDLTIGFATPNGLWQQPLATKQSVLHELSERGVDQIYMADHVSFRNGSGTDGMVEIAALSQLNESLNVMISVYLLALRHPLPVARQLATMSTIAPGRVTLGVGVGGEDRHEIEICGVDPRTRGRQTNECLAIIRQLMTGDKISFDGEFFSIEDAQIRPAVDPAIPIIIGGRSDAALRRTAAFGDGWVGAWCSARRFAQAVELIDAEATELGRGDTTWTHGYQPWVGVADTKAAARDQVAAAMEAFYKIPFEAFEKYTPYGTVDEVVETLLPYAQAGCSMFNLKVVGMDDQHSINAAGEIATKLRSA